MPQNNQYASTCFICREEVKPLVGLLDGKDAAGRSKVRHMGCLPSMEAAAEELRQPSFVQNQAGARQPENIPVLKDYLAEGERVLSDVEDAMGAMLDNVAAYVGQELDTRMEAGVPAMVERAMAKHQKLDVSIGDMPAVTVDVAHKALPDILLMVAAGTSPFLVGPAGSGKTTAAEQVAKIMALNFYMTARVTSEFKLMGFRDANGHTIRTQFREAFEHGGVFLFDEVDASDPDALTAFNAALANGIADFPDGLVRGHKDFHAIAAGNTFGRGADRQYVGRNQLDAATLDRFTILEVDYDEDLEHKLAGNVEWSTLVQRIRRAIADEKVRHIVSPRASIYGARLLAAGMAKGKVLEACVWKGLDDASRLRLVGNRHMAGVSL